MVFHVPDAFTETFRLQDPEHTEVINERWLSSCPSCRLPRSSPRIDALDRDIRSITNGFDATRLGFDAQQLDQIDPVAIFNLRRLEPNHG